MIKSLSYCAPDRENLYQRTGSCFTFDELKSMAESYNETATNENKIADKAFANHKSLLSALQSRYANSKTCKNTKAVDVCLVDNVHKSPKLEEALKPKKPREWIANRHEWLSTEDIVKVMRLYEKAYENRFQFIGVFPVDFSTYLGQSCVSPEMCQLMSDLEKKQFKKKQFGIVFNLDKHDGPGTHWVSLFCDLDPKSKKYGVYFYDSGGHKPRKSIHDFMKKIKPKDSSFKLGWNRKTQQFQNTECGMFSMLFLILCLENPNETYLKTKSRIATDNRDERVNTMRDVLYR